jgi:hypothetical protein
VAREIRARRTAGADLIGGGVAFQLEHGAQEDAPLGGEGDAALAALPIELREAALPVGLTDRWKLFHGSLPGCG